MNPYPLLAYIVTLILGRGKGLKSVEHHSHEISSILGEESSIPD